MRLLIAALGLLLVAVACGGDAPAPGASASASATPEAAASPSPVAAASIDPESLCRRIDDLDLSVARLRGIELKLVNRVPLDIELAETQLAFRELEAADLGEFEDRLEDPLKRLGYRLGELELAVEDFRTTRRPRRAAPHVEGDSETFANDLAAFRVLSRC